MDSQLQLLDTVYTCAHLLVIGFNMFGWIWNKLLKLHLICIIATAFSWFALGIWYGWGYCLLTDWQWEVKRQLGEKDLPASFISHMLQELSIANVPNNLVDAATAVLFFGAAGISIYKNIKNRRQ